MEVFWSILHIHKFIESEAAVHVLRNPFNCRTWSSGHKVYVDTVPLYAVEWSSFTNTKGRLLLNIAQTSYNRSFSYS